MKPVRKKIKMKMLATLLAVLAIAGGSTRAATDLNEVAALLVYPVVIGVPGQETLLSVTNTGPQHRLVHVSLIDGFAGTSHSPNPQYCNECDFEVELTGNDTELLTIVPGECGGIEVRGEDSSLHVACPMFVGMAVASIESPARETLTENVLLGDQVIIDYAGGRASSVPAIPFQGRNGGDGDRSFKFDDVEYSRFPRVVAGDFIAPDVGSVGPLTADLALFTLGFSRLQPPETHCAVTGYDAHENPFSGALTFGCWTLTSLWEISPEFAYPNLGQLSGPDNRDTHGWLMLDCDVDGPHLPGPVDGGVHGVILQSRTTPGPSHPPLSLDPASGAAWSRALFQSVTAGDPVTLHLQSVAPGLD